jgi:hypothetical protein
MDVGVELWVVGKRFLVKHIADSKQSYPDTDPPMVISDVPVLTNVHLHYFLWAQIPCLKGIRFKWQFSCLN